MSQMDFETDPNQSYIMCPTMGDQVPLAEEVESLITSQVARIEPGACIDSMLATQSELDELQRYQHSQQQSPNDSSRTRISGLATPAADVSPSSEDEEIDETDGHLGSPEFEDTMSSLSHTDIDLMNSPVWKNRRKHVFVFSESGKPIYSRHGNEEELVTLFGVMQALVSVVESSQDQLVCVRSESHLIVFLQKSPLTLVGVTRGSENQHQMSLQLVHVYDHILAVATLLQLKRFSEIRRNYDFRKMVSGAERYLDRLLDVSDASSTYLLEAVQCLRLDPCQRESIVGIIQSSCSRLISHLVFALLISCDRLVCMVRMKNVCLHPSDYLIICNIVSSTVTYKSVEGWTPICLPKLDPNGYLFAHISYVSESCPVCLVLVSSSRESFHELSSARTSIIEGLSAANITGSLAKACSDQNRDYSVGDTGVSSELRHFMYKCVSTAQFTCPLIDGVYGASAAGGARLSAVYHTAHGRLHSLHSAGATLQTFHCGGSAELVVAWRNSALEFYAVLEPCVSLSRAILLMNRVLAWIMSHERQIFILSAPVL